MSDDQREILNKIWITYKVRIISERRYRKYSLWTHSLISWYSMWLILLSLFSGTSSGVIPYYEQLLVAFSIAVFSLSLILYGFRFSETANQFRDCYLQLQSLYSRASKTDDLATAYHDLLRPYPNHLSRDYEDLVVEMHYRHEKLFSSTDDLVKPTRLMLAKYWLRHLTFFFLQLAAIALPPLLTWIFWSFSF